MKRRNAALAWAVASLMPAAWAQPAQGGQTAPSGTGGPVSPVSPVEGKHFARLGQPSPTQPGKIEVIEFFFYRCPHCFALDPALEAWAHRLPADVAFRRVPVGQQAVLKLHQRMFYALEAVGRLTPAVHTGIFNAFHRQGIDANDEAAVVALVGKLGVDTAKFRSAFNAFGVQAKLAQGQRLAELCGVETVPALVVAGRFRTGPGMAGTAGQSEAAQGQQALAVADFLIQRVRRHA